MQVEMHPKPWLGKENLCLFIGIISVDPHGLHKAQAEPEHSSKWELSGSAQNGIHLDPSRNNQ